MANQRKKKKIMFLNIGLALIVAGIVSGAVSSMMFSQGQAKTAEQRGQMFGAALMGALILLAGIVMVIVHFVRARKNARPEFGNGNGQK